MQKLIYVIFLLGAICDQNFSDYRKFYREYKNDNNVVVLDKDNFKTVLDTVDKVLVEFYAPWCKHCKELAPVYSNIASTLQTQEKNILITKLNAHEEKEIASEYQIKGYPTLILFTQGQQEKYEGPMQEKEILNWLNRKLNRKARQIYTQEEFQKMQKKKLSILYVFPNKNKQAQRRLQQVAQYFDRLPFFYTHDKDLIDEVDCKDQYCLLVYRNFDDGLRTMKNKDSFGVQSMIQFIDNLRYPYIEELNEEVLQRYIHRSDSVMVYFGDDLESNEYKAFTKFARENSKFIKFALNQFQSELNDVIANFADVKTEDLPTVRILKLSPNNIEKFKIEKITYENLQDALQQFNNNQLSALYKSEDIPNENNELIKKLVGKNFEEIISNDKYVFVDVYAPECEECLQLQEIYNQLAQEYKDNTTVEFYKIDVSKNEHALLKIQGLPTFRLYKPNKKQHKEYDGPRTYEEIKAFIDIELNEEDIDTDI